MKLVDRVKGILGLRDNKARFVRNAHTVDDYLQNAVYYSAQIDKDHPNVGSVESFLGEAVRALYHQPDNTQELKDLYFERMVLIYTQAHARAAMVLSTLVDEGIAASLEWNEDRLSDYKMKGIPLDLDARHVGDEHSYNVIASKVSTHSDIVANPRESFLAYVNHISEVEHIGYYNLFSPQVK